MWRTTSDTQKAKKREREKNGILQYPNFTPLSTTHLHANSKRTRQTERERDSEREREREAKISEAIYETIFCRQHDLLSNLRGSYGELSSI